jgi:hypothetical protein
MHSTDQFFTDEHLNDSGIALYVDAIVLDRTEALPDSVLSHVEECDTCKHQILQVAELVRMQPRNSTIVHPFFDAPIVQPTSFPVWYRIAAVFLVLVAAGTIFFLVNTTEHTGLPDMSTVRPAADTAKSVIEMQTVEQSSALIAEHFAPSPNLDDLVQSEFRSAAVDVLAPSNGESVRPPITFRWRHSGHPMKLKVLSNKEITVLTAIVTADSFTTAKKFEPGLYYWKLENREELLFIGRFFVR